MIHKITEYSIRCDICLELLCNEKDGRVQTEATKKIIQDLAKDNNWQVTDSTQICEKCIESKD